MAAVSSTALALGRRIHVKKLGLEGEATDESYWLWLDFPESIKGLRSKCMQAFEPPQDHSIRFIVDDGLLCGDGLETLPNKSELWVQFVPKSAPLTPVSIRKSRKKRTIPTEDDENVDPCPLSTIDAGSPIRKRQRLHLRLGVSNLDLSAPSSPSPSESLKPTRTPSPFVTTINSRCASPCQPLKPIALDVPRNRRNRSNASASFFEPAGAPTGLTTRPTTPISPNAIGEGEGVPVIAWEIENQDESYYGYGILSLDKPRHDWVPSIAFDLLPRYSAGVPEGIEFNLLVCDVAYDMTVGEIRAALAANLALDPERLPQNDFRLIRKGQPLEDWMTCVPAYLADGDAVFLEFGNGSMVQLQGQWDHDEESLVHEDLEEIRLVTLPCDSDEE